MATASLVPVSVSPSLWLNWSQCWPLVAKDSATIPQIFLVSCTPDYPKPMVWCTAQGGTFRHREDFQSSFSCQIHLGSGPCMLAICPCSISWVSALGNCMSSNEGIITGLFA